MLMAKQCGYQFCVFYIEGLMQKKHNSSALAMEVFCINSLI